MKARNITTNKKVNKISFCNLFVKKIILKLEIHKQTQKKLNKTIRPREVNGTVKGAFKNNHPLDIISIENCSKGSIYIYNIF